MNRALSEPGFQGILMESEHDGGPSSHGRQYGRGYDLAGYDIAKRASASRTGPTHFAPSGTRYWAGVPFEQEEAETVAAPSGNLTVRAPAGGSARHEHHA